MIGIPTNNELDATALEADARNENWAAGLDVVCLTDVRAKPIEWLWPGRVALGKVTVLAGDGGLGKSTILCDWAARTSTGSSWPDGKPNDCSGSTIILAAEDAPEDTIKPRLAAAGADMAKVFSITAVREKQNGTRRTFNLQADLKNLEAEIAKISDVRLVIIDPISSYLGKIDSHKNADVRSVLEPLGQLATRSGCAIVCNNHFSKGAGGANSRIIGSVAFVNQARAAFIVTPDATDESKLLFIPSKMNIAELGDGLAYRIGGYLASVDGMEIPTSQVCWESAPLGISANAALAALADKDGDAGTAIDDARAFLTDLLAAGPVSANDVKRHAADAGIAWVTVRRAKEHLVDCRPDGTGKDRWKWSLTPQGAQIRQDAHPSGMSILGSNEHLASTTDPADLPARAWEDDLPEMPTNLRQSSTLGAQ